MFEVSIFLFLKALFLNIFIPIIPGIIFIWIFFSNKFKGIDLYIISFFIGTGFIFSSLFNLGFIHFGLGIKEYFFILILIFLCFLLKLFLLNENIKKYFETLKFNKFNIKINSKYINKYIIYIMITFILIYFVISFIYNISFPNYAIDSFFNWNSPIINLFYDGGIHYSGEHILGGGFLGYPISIPIYKALVSNFLGFYNDIYINIWNYLIFIFFSIFIYNFTFLKTKDTFFSLLPIILIIGLPLIFFHIVEGMLDLACAIYSVFTIYFLNSFLEGNKKNDLVLGLLFGFILSNLKNEGLIIYFGGILFIFFMILLVKKRINILFLDKKTYFKILFFVLFFVSPFIILKLILGLGYNQAAWTQSGTGISSDIHLKSISDLIILFFNSNNFSISLIFIVFIILGLFSCKNIFKKYFFKIFSGVLIFINFFLVFLIGDNYNYFFFTAPRLYSMSIIIIFSFSGELFYDLFIKKDFKKLK